MKDVDKRARITVALHGLILLLDEHTKNTGVHGNCVTRNDLFAVPHNQKHNPDLKNAIRSRTWQKPYVKRLVDAGILAHKRIDSQDVYYPVHVPKLVDLIQDHEEPNYGLRLSQFIFPSEAGLPKELRGSPDHVEEAGAENGGTQVCGPDEGTDSDKQIVLQRLQDYINETQALHSEVAVVSGHYARLTKQIEESVLFIRSRVESIEKHNEEQSRLMAKIVAPVAHIDETITQVWGSLGDIHSKLTHLDLAGAVTSAVTTAVHEVIKKFEGGSAKRIAAERVLRVANDLTAAADLLLQSEEGGK